MECLSLSLPTCWRRRNNKRCVRDDLLLIEINSGQQMRPFRHKDTGQLRGTTWYIPSMYPAESLNSATIAVSAFTVRVLVVRVRQCDMNGLVVDRG